VYFSTDEEIEENYMSDREKEEKTKQTDLENPLKSLAETIARWTEIGRAHV